MYEKKISSFLKKQNKSYFDSLMSIYVLFCELKKEGFTEDHLSVEIFLQINDHLKSFTKPDLDDNDLMIFRIENYKYINDAFSKSLSNEIRHEKEKKITVDEIVEPVVELDQPDDFFDSIDRDSIQDKIIDWDFLKKIGMEHPDE